MIIQLIVIILVIAILVLYLRQIYSSFRKYGVKHEPPLPLFGNMARVMFRMDHVVDNVIKFYNRYPEERFLGMFEFTNESIIIRDLELIKQITVKDFDYFINRRFSTFSEHDSFFGRSLFALKGQEWKDMRATLSPAFTSSKIRAMVPLIVEVGDQMMTDLKSKIQNTDANYIVVDCKDLTTRYANDVIASCAFGLKVNSLKEVDNEFYIKGKEVTNFSIRQMLKIFLMLSLPILAKILKLEFLPSAATGFFKKIISDTMRHRELKNIIRPDMIHLLMEAKKGRLTHETDKSKDADVGFATVEESDVGTKKVDREWDDDDITAQAVLFLFAGFETVSTSMTFFLYELAVNPDVQDRLAKEIREFDEKNNGKFDFDSIQSMTYLDMVTSEILRLWPPTLALDRQCNKDYNLGKPNKNATKDYILHKGMGISIPSIAIHRDPQLFPNPNKFDPERFSEENKHKIHPFAYSPFGLGPRNCIGSRFALCEVKIMIYQILLHMEVSPCETTCIPAKLSRNSFNIKLEGGHNLIFRVRS